MTIEQQIKAIQNSKKAYTNPDGIIYPDEAYDQANEKGNEIKRIKPFNK